MATTYHQQIQSLYVAYFNRPADAGGLAHWEAAVEAANGDTTAVSAAFAASAEYKTAYANMTNAQIVDKVYQNLFGRAAEQAGKDYWAGLMTEGKITIDAVVAEISKGALGTDKTAFESKVAFAQAFTAAMDTDAEKAGYNADSIDEAKALVAGIKTAADLEAAIAPAALNASVAAVVKAGTPFTVLSALQALEAAVEAKEDFLAEVDGDGKASTSADEEDIETNNIDDAHVAIAAAFADDTAYVAATSDNVRAALVADEVAANATALKNGQNALAAANKDIAEVSGLASAIASLTAADKSVTAAEKSNTAAQAEADGKLAAYNTLNGGSLAINADYTVTGVIKLSSGKPALATGVTEADNPGVTALLAALTALQASDVALAKAEAAADLALFNVQILDADPAQATATADALVLVKDKMVDFAAQLGTKMPTIAQIIAQQQILDKKAAEADDPDAGPEAIAAAEFEGLVADYRTAADSDLLHSAFVEANDGIAAATAAATALSKATAALTKAKAEAAQLAALNAAIEDAEAVFGDEGFFVENIDASFEVGSADSDIFVVGDVDSTISLFGLEGNDQVYIGSGYKVNTGALSTGDDTALEVFVKQVGSDTTLTIETSKFGSSAVGDEVVVVTLVGVDAATIQLNNGIITQSGTGA